MLHSNFADHKTSGSGEDFERFFTIYGRGDHLGHVAMTYLINYVHTYYGCSIFNGTIFILAGNEDMHESLDEFKFRPDTTTDFRVICH